MAKTKDPFIESLKANLAKTGLPGEQRDVVTWLVLRYIEDVNIIAGLNHNTLKRQQLLQLKQNQLLAELEELADTEEWKPEPPKT